jgi:hypothetical protein
MFRIATGLFKYRKIINKTIFSFAIEADKAKIVSMQMNEKVEIMK